ncbi:hypothetical protein HPB48_019791 [Haemaphysalis longicornis]|uniref:PG1 pseudoGTPase domain-containing protein n=1 Tax=Haemaphysalis longicornis TaxID=44386 RepID=A0A9J6GAE9_HAELO|nr:hypothetical protein HPB48_019791 [Haemaphysalis longicornis]
MDGVIEQLLHRREAGTNGGGVLGANDRRLHLVVLGAGGSAQQVAQAMRQAHPQGFRLDDKAQYALDFRIIDGDVGLPHNLFRTEPHGCLCVYASQPELKYIRESLEKTLLANLEQEDRLPFHGLPLVMVFAGQGDFMREEGINRAKSLQCPFVDDGGEPGPRAAGAGAVRAGGEHRAAGGPASHLPGAARGRGAPAGPAADAVHDHASRRGIKCTTVEKKMNQFLQQRYAIKFCVKLGKNGAETLQILRTSFGGDVMKQRQTCTWH